MIKINFPILDEPLVLSNATILTIEDVSVYSSLVKHFYQYDVDEHLKLFDDKQKSLKATELMLVTDILGYDVNSAPILKLIHGDLENQFNEKQESLQKAIDEIREKFDFLSIQKASSLSEGSRVIYRNKLIGGHAASQNKEDKDVS